MPDVITTTKTFEDVCGQDTIVKILKNQIAAGSMSHAYLFCGTRGTGKTTTARILAKAANCLSDEARPCGVCAHCKAIKEGKKAGKKVWDKAEETGKKVADKVEEVGDDLSKKFKKSGAEEKIEEVTKEVKEKVKKQVRGVIL